MTTDRELLEWAAKAAGLDVEFMPLSGANLLSGPHAGLWRPLTDDGDALRLANKLWLEVRHVHGQAHAGMTGRFWKTESWFPDGDQDAATRRAIVRAAASIGQQMEGK